MDFTCGKCNKNYKTNSGLWKHIKRKHGNMEIGVYISSTFPEPNVYKTSTFGNPGVYISTPKMEIISKSSEKKLGQDIPINMFNKSDISTENSSKIKSSSSKVIKVKSRPQNSELSAGNFSKVNKVCEINQKFTNLNSDNLKIVSSYQNKVLLNSNSNLDQYDEKNTLILPTSDSKNSKLNSCIENYDNFSDKSFNDYNCRNCNKRLSNRNSRRD